MEETEGWLGGRWEVGKLGSWEAGKLGSWDERRSVEASLPHQHLERIAIQSVTALKMS